jgi:hypothetical protein
MAPHCRYANAARDRRHQGGQRISHSGVAITEHLYLDADTARQREAMERRNEGVRRGGEDLDRIAATQQSTDPEAAADLKKSA